MYRNGNLDRTALTVFLKGKMKVRLSINEQGKHNESYWSDEFPKAIEWLFFSDKPE